MKNLSILLFAICLVLSACSLDPAEPIVDNLPSAANGDMGATQISGIGFYAGTEDCDYVQQGADFALELTGDLTGCLFVFVEDYGCSPSGTYRETGKEYFVGTYKGEQGTFWTNYRFTSKFEGCSDDGFFLGAEIFGRCQHPLEKGSGTGIFEGMTGRIDFKDDIEAQNFPYRGHFKIENSNNYALNQD
jgi:hypothetical protein